MAIRVEQTSARSYSPESLGKIIRKCRRGIKYLPSDDVTEGSTNFGKFIEYFSMDDSRWIQIINIALEK